MGGRRQNKLELRGNVYIVGEGITEQFYFSHLKFLRKYNYIVKPRFFGKNSISEIQKSVEKLLLGGVTVICVFDADVSVRNVSENENLKKFRRKYASNPHVILCDSFPSIEFWFLLHYTKTTRNFQSADEALIALNRYMPDFYKERSFLENIKWVENLCQDDKLATALVRSSEILAEKEQEHVGEYFPYTKIGVGIGWFDRKSK